MNRRLLFQISFQWILLKDIKTKNVREKCAYELSVALDKVQFSRCNRHPHDHYCNHLLIIIVIIITLLIIIIIVIVNNHCNYHHHHAKMCLVGRLLFQTADSEALHQFCGQVRCVQILSSTFRQIVILSMSCSAGCVQILSSTFRQIVLLSMSCSAGCVQIFLKLWMSYKYQCHVKE